MFLTVNSKKDSKFFRPWPYYLVPFWVGLLVFLMSYFPALVFALPQGGQIVAGNGNIQQPNNQNMVINQSSNQMITNWQGFNIGQTETVQFNQPSADAVALNRVIGQDPTAILGKLNANGKIFVTNPSGVFFGPNSIINVGSLMATSLQISDQDFLNRNYRFTQDPSKPLASVINEGKINASGYIGLLGPRAENRGMLMANLGSIALASGKAATMDFSGDGLINFAITQPVDGSFVDKDGNTIENGAFNSGTIQADGGKVLLTAHTAQKMVRSVVNNTGIIRAQSVSKRNGAIYLEAGPNGTATNEGTLDASGTGSGETGGSVRILGHKVGQLGKAIIDVSGHQGGGEVLIGGDYQGKGTVQNALVTYGGPDTVVKANAINNGNGGKVIYWSDDTTRFYGAIEAKGGANSGDGGFVEVSGKRFLDFNGEVITTAANGEIGTLLLDPEFIDIVNGTADDDPEISTGSPLGEILEADGGLVPFEIGELTLESLSSTTNIVLQAEDSITIQDLNDNLLDLQQVSGHSVTLQASFGSITFQDTNDVLQTQGGSITFSAGDSLTLGTLKSNGGDINLTSGFSIDTKGIDSKGGDVNLFAFSGINVKGNILTGGGNFSADAGLGTYTQDFPMFVKTNGGSVSLLASDFEFLSGSTGKNDIFGVPSSINTYSTSFNTGAEPTDSITIASSIPGDSICVGKTGCFINLSQSEIISLRTTKLNIGDIFTGDINLGDVILGPKKVNFISGESITALGANILFYNDISFDAAEDVSFFIDSNSKGSSIEAHVSGFGASVTVTADSDGLNGGVFTIDNSSSITTRGGNVNLTGNFVDVFGQINTNGGVLTTLELPTVFASVDSFDPFFFLEEDPFPFPFPEDPFPFPFPEDPFPFPFPEDPFPNILDPFLFPDIPIDDETILIFGLFPDLPPEEFIKIVEDNEQAQQVSVLDDFLDKVTPNPGC